MKKSMIALILAMSIAAAPASACTDGFMHDGDEFFANYYVWHFTKYVAEKRLAEEKAEQEAEQKRIEAEKIKAEEERKLCEEACHDEVCCGCSVPAEYIGQFEITYYCDQGLTATGTYTEIGVCGVDPAVIPLGSTIFIEYDDGSIRECRAEDTGGAVIGNIIDVWLPDEDMCWALGRDIAKVYLVTEE